MQKTGGPSFLEGRKKLFFGTGLTYSTRLRTLQIAQRTENIKTR